MSSTGATNPLGEEARSEVEIQALRQRESGSEWGIPGLSREGCCQYHFTWPGEASLLHVNNGARLLRENEGGGSGGREK